VVGAMKTASKCHVARAVSVVPSYNRNSFLLDHIQLAQPEEENALSMARGRRGVDASLLEAALIGFEQMKRNVEEKIADIRRQLGSRDGTRGTGPGQARRRTLSPAARRRMAAAQRKRWAAVKAKSKPPKPANTKRTMSPAARKRIAAAQRKRWALVKAKKGG
jgi:hypothetical protein